MSEKDKCYVWIEEDKLKKKHLTEVDEWTDRGILLCEKHA